MVDHALLHVMAVHVFLTCHGGSCVFMYRVVDVHVMVVQVFLHAMVVHVCYINLSGLCFFTCHGGSCSFSCHGGSCFLTGHAGSCFSTCHMGGAWFLHLMVVYVFRWFSFSIENPGISKETNFMVTREWNSSV